MLTLPRNNRAPCLLGRGMPTIFLGIFRPAKVGNFQSAKTGEYSTGVDRFRDTEPRTRG